MKNNARINLKINEPTGVGAQSWQPRREPSNNNTTPSKDLDEALNDLNLE
jgi:hypothetical protein